MIVMKCKNCGKDLASGCNVCPRCGESVEIFVGTTSCYGCGCVMCDANFCTNCGSINTFKLMRLLLELKNGGDPSKW